VCIKRDWRGSISLAILRTLVEKALAEAGGKELALHSSYATIAKVS